MSVDSYPELFTTLFGWHFYGIVWEALSAIGIVYIPFIVILVRNWMEPAKGGDFGNIWSLSLKRMEIEFYLAVFVAMIAGVPAMTLQAQVLTYDPPPTLADPAPAQATISAPQSTYGTNGSFAGAPGQVGVPVWWYTVMTLSKGLNHAIVTGMPGAIGIRQIQQQAHLATIADPRLRQEAGQFFNDCYIPARSRYLREKPSGAAVAGILSDYGEDDTEWMGSHVYRALYYPNMRAQRRVVGWAYDPNRDRNYDPSIAHVWGQPTCQQWWEDGGKGLRKKLKDEVDGLSSLGGHLASATTALAGWFPVLTNAAEKQTDWTVRAALENSRVDAMQAYRGDDFGTYSSREGVIDHVTGWVADVAGAAGAGMENIGARIKMNAIKPVLPIIQALILLAIYALLPLIVVLSNYSLSMVVAGAIGIFTVNFWTVLWKLGQWADENIMLAMFPGTMDGLLMSTTGFIGLGNISTGMILDATLAVFMLGLPLLWSAMMAWVGVNVFRMLSTDVLGAGTRPAQDAGDKGGEYGKKAASGGYNRKGK